MQHVSINVHERLEALVARREKRNPGLGGTQVKKPIAVHWRNLINDTTKYEMKRNLLRGLRRG